MRLALRISIVTAVVVAASLAIFLGFVARSGKAAPCHECGYDLPIDVLVAKVSIPKGTSASAIESHKLTSTKSLRQSERLPGMLWGPSEIRGEVAIRTIPAGALLNASDFALRGPIYYPRGYPKSIPASQV